LNIENLINNKNEKERGISRMEKQLKLFDIPEKLYRRGRGSLYYVEIIEEDGEKYIIWLRRKIDSIAQAKKVAAITYNKQRGYNPENFVKFGKVKKV
jgi:hypothetical protein